MQAKLPASLKAKMQAIVPGLTIAHLAEMMKIPFRTVDPGILSEPHLYRMQEVGVRGWVGAACCINALPGGCSRQAGCRGACGPDAGGSAGASITAF